MQDLCSLCLCCGPVLEQDFHKNLTLYRPFPGHLKHRLHTWHSKRGEQLKKTANLHCTPLGTLQDRRNPHNVEYIKFLDKLNGKLNDLNSLSIQCCNCFTPWATATWTPSDSCDSCIDFLDQTWQNEKKDEKGTMSCIKYQNSRLGLASYGSWLIDCLCSQLYLHPSRCWDWLAKEKIVASWSCEPNPKICKVLGRFTRQFRAISHRSLAVRTRAL